MTVLTLHVFSWSTDATLTVGKLSEAFRKEVELDLTTVVCFMLLFIISDNYYDRPVGMLVLTVT